MNAKIHTFEAGTPESRPKPGAESNGTITVKNSLDFPIMITCTNSFWGMQSGGCIEPGESLEMYAGASAALDVFCWYGKKTGEMWEGTYPFFSLHYHDVKWTVWVGQTAEFTAKAAAAGG